MIAVCVDRPGTERLAIRGAARPQRARRRPHGRRMARRRLADFDPATPLATI